MLSVRMVGESVRQEAGLTGSIHADFDRKKEGAVSFPDPEATIVEEMVRPPPSVFDTSIPSVFRLPNSTRSF